MGGRGWWGTPLYKLYRYVPPHQVRFFRRFGLKMGVNFAHFGLELGMVFEGTTGVYERSYHFNSNEKSEIEICKFNMHCLRSNLNNDDIISALTPFLPSD